jgi:hypothetical protein
MIYLIADTERKWCKIGHSNSPKERIKAIQTGCPFDVEIVNVVEGGCKEEKELHKLFKQYYIRGEWFQYNQEIVQKIDSMVQLPHTSGGYNKQEVEVDIEQLKKVLIWISDNLPYNSEEIILNKHNKNKIVAYTGFSYSAVEKSIGSLTSKRILVKDEGCVRCAVYRVNPSYVWYGDSSNRTRSLELVLKMAQEQDMDASEKRMMEDIKRAEDGYKREREAAKSEYHKSYRKQPQEVETVNQ